MGRPALTFAVHENGRLEIRSPWFPFVAFPRAVLESKSGSFRLDGNELTVTCVNGGAIYRLEPQGNGTRPGRLLRSW